MKTTADPEGSCIFENLVLPLLEHTLFSGIHTHVNRISIFQRLPGPWPVGTADGVFRRYE
jgi:hypothetical protein